MKPIDKWTDDELLGRYQHFHGNDEMSKMVRGELVARGYEPRTEKFLQAGGRMGYSAIVYKNGKRVL